MHTRRAFTLIEVLVVISVTTILLGLLMPAIGKAKAPAQPNAVRKFHKPIKGPFYREYPMSVILTVDGHVEYRAAFFDLTKPVPAGYLDTFGLDPWAPEPPAKFGYTWNVD